MLLGIFVAPNTHIGNIRLLDIDRAFSRCSIGMLIGEEQHWGKGFASEAIITITNFAFFIIDAKFYHILEFKVALKLQGYIISFNEKVS